MQRRHKYLWMRGKCEWDFTQDGRFDKIMIPRKERKIYKNVKRDTRIPINPDNHWVSFYIDRIGEIL